MQLCPGELRTRLCSDTSSANIHCTKKPRFWLRGTGAQNRMLSWGHVQTKAHFHSPKYVFQQYCLPVISSVCLCVPYCLQCLPGHWELLLLSPFTENIFLINSSVSISCDKPSCALSYVALQRLTECHLFLNLRISYFKRLKWAISLNTQACQYPK